MTYPGKGPKNPTQTKRKVNTNLGDGPKNLKKKRDPRTSPNHQTRNGPHEQISSSKQRSVQDELRRKGSKSECWRFQKQSSEAATTGEAWKLQRR